MAALDSIYGAYPNPMLYAGAQTNSLGMTDDFMANATSANQLAMQQALLQGYQQPACDTFENTTKSSSGFGTGATLGILGGVGTGAGVYFLASDPIKDGKIVDGLFDSANKVCVEDMKNAKFKELYAQQKALKLNKFGLTPAQYEAIQQLARAEKLDDLADAVKRELPASIQTPDLAKQAVKNIKPDLEKINIQKLEQDAAKYAERINLSNASKKLKELEAAKAKIAGLNQNATKAEVEAFIKENAKTLGINCKPEKLDEVAKNMANKYQTQGDLLQQFEHRIASQKTNVQKIKNRYQAEILSHWDDSAKAFKESTPEALTKAVKNFKWTKALKFGGIAAGVGLALGWLLGGNKS